MSISSEKRDPEELRQARESFFDRSLDLLCLASFDGWFVEVNAAWERILGWTADDLVSRPYVDFIHPEDIDATLCAATSLADGGDVIRFHNRYRHRDGSWRSLTWTAYADQERRLIYAVAHDVTEERRLQERLHGANEELRAVAEHKDQFVATASHELRTPITAIAGFASTLLRYWDGLADGERREFVSIIDQQSTRLARLVDDLLRMALLDVGAVSVELGDVPIEPVLSEAARLATGYELRISCDEQLAARADRDLLVQVFANLITNAVRYGAPPFDLVASRREDGIAVRVDDHGPGVPDEFRPHLFAKFAQARRTLTDPVHGTGLGLSICEALLEAMEGSVAYEPRDGGGASFVVTLPPAGNGGNPGAATA